MKNPKNFAAALIPIVFMILLFVPQLATARLELRANLTVENVETVYAIATSQFKSQVTIPLSYEPSSKLYGGSAETEDAGEYAVTIFVVQNMGGKKYFTNQTLLENLFTDDCKTDKNCAPMGSEFLCGAENKCETCSCGLDGKCNACCENLEISDYDCKNEGAAKLDEIIFKIDATERGVIKVLAFENVVQDLQVSASREEAVSESKTVQGLTASVAAAGANITVTMPSGKKIEAVADGNGYARVQIDRNEFGQILVSAQKGEKTGTGKFGKVALELKGPAKILTEAKKAVIVTAQIAAVPAAAMGGWAIISFLSHLAIIFQSLVTAQLSMSKAQIGRIKAAVQLIVLSFLLFSLRKIFAVINEIHFGGFNFDLTYAISELLFFGIFLLGVMELNSSMKELSEKNPATGAPKAMPSKRA